MKTLIVTCVLAAGGCFPSMDFDFDLDFPDGYVTGSQGNATLSYVDGCTGGDALFGCGDQLAPLAVGAEARFVLGSTTGDAEDEQRVGRATADSDDTGIVEVSRDPDGVLHVDARSRGDANVVIRDGGDVVDSFPVHVGSIATLVKPDPAGQPYPILVGSPFPAGVSVHDATGATMYAHRAVGLVLGRSMSFVPDIVPFFTASDAVAVQITKAGDTQLTWSTDTEQSVVRYRGVTRDDIESISITEYFPTAGANKMTLEAEAQVDDEWIGGGPVCDWSIVSGSAELSAFSGNPFTNALFVLRTGVQIYGTGDVTLECRANGRVAATHTVHLGP